MDGLFSDQPVIEPVSEAELPARETSVSVPVPPEQAFKAFTDLIHLWWPLAEYSAFGAESHLGFEQQSLLEESAAGERYLWGTVLEWQPSASVLLDFFLGGDPARPTRLRADFEPDDGGSRVRLVQDGWAAGQAGASQYEKYSDWPFILGRYVRFMGG
ncbi:uncharacterized protein YndB with AHSA1/START domain [Psychromicrobium silvestre]|uniref:Uncharacterized protein YndB with AHSA1/START domain n=1 Tax=Psychromicrobium silvestre TaxID=1645614 RepID=A0A7Y9S5Y8_9MICC|nr:SRPBCC domain-containing protein [Psychromicrobium silvestre]NYE93832.1 uncharacterized protein YndB with AHSA1/START domain [Psychromicrobium silvestre]